MLIKPHCETCQRPLAPDKAAWICSFECTFCECCTADYQGQCPNCQGELVARPRRTTMSETVAEREGLRITSDVSVIPLDSLLALLKQAYWNQLLTLDKLPLRLAHALCFGMFDGNRLIGFARWITDYTTFAYLADVIVDPAFRGRGLGKWLVDTMIAYPKLQGLRTWLLRTQDAHGLYAQYGFQPLNWPDRWMERLSEFERERQCHSCSCPSGAYEYDYL